jgi:hydroxysqualene dehydroxylase
MKHVCVIGGGLAGLTSAVYLSSHGYNVELFEASPKLGGRTYSLSNPVNGDKYDNGQHILMGCYEETLRLINIIGSHGKLDSQPSLAVNFIERGGRISTFKTSARGYPVNLLIGILRYDGLRIRDRLRAIDFFLDLLCSSEEDLTDLTAFEWLKMKNQSDRSIQSLWEIIITGALNTSARRASAEMFCRILKLIFFLGRNSSAILIPSTGLHDLFVAPSRAKIESKNGKIFTSEKLESIDFEDGKAVSFSTTRRTVSGFDYLILALPLYALGKIRMKGLGFAISLPGLVYSPILNLHLWLSRNPFGKKFYGLIGSDLQWLFNHGSYVSLTSSSAEKLIGLANGEIIEHFCTELGAYFPSFRPDYVIDSEVIKEKRATFIPDISSNQSRKERIGLFQNLEFAGDWTDTGLPATIEGAVLSGKSAFEKAKSFLTQ